MFLPEKIYVRYYCIHKVSLHLWRTGPDQLNALMIHMSLTFLVTMTFLVTSLTISDWSISIHTCTLNGETCGYCCVAPHRFATLKYVTTIFN